MKKSISLLALLSACASHSSAQCVSNPANIYSFRYDGNLYEIVKENKTWQDAATCAVTRGGKLAEINSQQEQDSVFYFVNQAGIAAANTVAPDGGGASYVWLGGTDRQNEGAWYWDGYNMGSFLQFWQGTANGSAVNGQYSNWGNEPDNWNNQDGLGLAITNWPLGVAGQWNDVMESNTLYYIIEYFGIPTSINEREASEFSIYPNPVEDAVTLKARAFTEPLTYRIVDALGKVVLTGLLQREETRIDVSTLTPGIYILLAEGAGTHAYRLVKN